MPRARFVGPPNPDPDGNELGHAVPLAGRTVRPDEIVDLPGQVVGDRPDAWLVGEPAKTKDAEPDVQYALPKVLWQVEDEPARRPAAAKSKEE